MQANASGAVVTAAEVEKYLKAVLGQQVQVLALTPLDDPAGRAMKEFGYGTPVRVDYEGPDGRRSAVLHSMSPRGFGHEHMSDRGRILLWSHRAFNRLPRHVRSLDVGGIEAQGAVVPLGNVEEFCLLTEYAEGQAYAADLARMRDTGQTSELDRARSRALCEYLTKIHSQPGGDPELYVRRTRELVGDSECIMGLADSYPPHPVFTAAALERIEHQCVRWRWRLKGFTHRLRTVHGDFHPWNILFAGGTDFRLLDRSRGEFGDPADDVTCLTLNYVFFSLQRSGRLEGIFETLFLGFWDRYLERTGDAELLKVAAPYFTFRALVMASPVWYPHLPEAVRGRLLAFIQAVLDQETFDPHQVNQYCGA